MKKRSLFLVFLLAFFPMTMPAQELEPFAVVSVRDAMTLSQKMSMFLASADPQQGAQAAMLLNMLLLSPQMAPIDIQNPITAYLYYSDPEIQPVFFATRRPDINPQNIPILSGRVLEPHTGKNNSVVYYEKSFTGEAKNLRADSIKVPAGDISGIYYFRDILPVSGYEDSGDLVNLMSTELDQISFVLQFPSANQMKLKFELTAVADGDLADFSNTTHPVLNDKVQVLDQAKICIYALIPAHNTVGNGFSVLCSMIPSEYLDPETVTGLFLNSVISGEHDSALAFSQNGKFQLASGIIPAGEQRSRFLDFLQNNGTRFDDGTFLLRNPDNTEIHVKINGNIVNLLLFKNNGKEVNVNSVFASLTPASVPLAEREFLKGVLPKNGNKTILTGSMKDGKFHLDFSVAAEQLRVLK